LAITPEIEAYIAQQVRMLTQQQITEQNRRLSFLPTQVATPIRERPEATQPVTKDFDIKTVFKHIKDDVKFTGSGKTPSQDLYNLQKQIEVAFHSVDAPQEYFDILEDPEDTQAAFAATTNKHLYLILHKMTEGKAHDLVQRFVKLDGRQAWRALHKEYLPVDSLATNDLLGRIHMFVIKSGPPEPQIDLLQRMIETALKVVDSKYPFLSDSSRTMSSIYISALARGDRNTYGELVTSLTRTSLDTNVQVSVQEIRTLAGSAYNNARARDRVQKPHTTAAAGGRGQGGRAGQGRGTGGRGGGRGRGSPKEESEGGSEGSKGPKLPKCKICLDLGQSANHWHHRCPNNPAKKDEPKDVAKARASASSSTKKVTVHQSLSDSE
jgi:hypothetical protein